MSTYDFLIGLKIGEYHNRTLKYERIELTDEPNEIYKRLGEMISDVLKNSTIEIANRKEIQQVLLMIENILAKEEYSSENTDIIDNCFDIIAYLGLEADAFRRDDIVMSDAELRPVMAYLVNTKVEDVDERIAPALGFFTEDQSRGSVSDVVMEAFRSKIRINPSLESIVRLPVLIENYELMTKVNAGSDMDTARLSC